MKTELMVQNANQIALYFASFPKEEAVAGVADHLQKFCWQRKCSEVISEENA